MSDDPEDRDSDPDPDALEESGPADSGAEEPGSPDSGTGDGGVEADGAGGESPAPEDPGGSDAEGSRTWPEDWITAGEADDGGEDRADETVDTDDGGPTDDADREAAGDETPADVVGADDESPDEDIDDESPDEDEDVDDELPDEDEDADDESPSGAHGGTDQESPTADAGTDPEESGPGDPGGLPGIDPGGGLSSLQEADGGTGATADGPTGPDGVPVLAPVEYGPKPAPDSGDAAVDDEDDDGDGAGDGDDEGGGLRKVETDRPEEERRHRPDTSGPDRPDEQPPPSPGENRSATEPRSGGSTHEGPPPGHAVGAPAPGEIESPGDVGSPEEGVPEPVADPEIEVGARADAEDAADEAGGGAVPSPPDPDGEPSEPSFGPPAEEPTAPPDDQEMPLAEHIEEMIGRLGVVFVAVAVATAVAFVFAEGILLEMWYDILPVDRYATPDGGADPDSSLQPRVYSPLEKILSEIKIASLAGILVALPVLVYQTYKFMRPGLYKHERRYFLAAIPTSLVLGFVGMLFAYFLVLPFMFDYFVVYSEAGVDELAFSLRVTVDLIVAMLGAFAIVFQIPLLIMLAIMMGVTSRRWLEARRIYFWGAFLGIGFLLGLGDPTGMAPFIITLTMIVLFEGTLALLRWTDR